MAMTTLEQDTVSKGCKAARAVVEDLKPLIDRLNIIYDAADPVGLKYTITQPKLDSVTSFSGLTKTQLDDGMYALTNTLRTAITNAYTALVELAARG